MEDPPLDPSSDAVAAPTSVDPDPVSSLEDDAWVTAEEPIVSDPQTMGDEPDLTVSIGGIEYSVGSNPEDSVSDGGSDVDPYQDLFGTPSDGPSPFGDGPSASPADPFAMPSDPSPPTFEDPFSAGTAPVEDLTAEVTRLRYEATSIDELADVSEASAGTLEEKAERSEQREENREERAAELRERARDASERGRKERAEELRHAARRVEGRAEDAEELTERREARADALHREAESYRAESEGLRSEAQDLEIQDLYGNSEETDPYGIGSAGDGETLERVLDPEYPEGALGAGFGKTFGSLLQPEITSGSIAEAISGVALARPLDGPVPLADIAGRLDDGQISEIVNRISNADLAKGSDAISSALKDSLAAGGSPIDVGKGVTDALKDEFGEDAEDIGDAVTGAFGGLLEGNSDAEKIGDTLLGAVDKVLQGESPADAVRAALNDAGLGQYGDVAERAITVAEKIADGDFAGAAEAAGLDDELDPVLGGYRAAAGLVDGDAAEVGRGLAQAAGYGDHVDTAEHLLEGDFEQAAVSAAKVAGFDDFGAAADNIARGDLAGAGEEALRAGGYGDYYDTADKIVQGDVEAAAVQGADLAGSAVGLTGVGGSVENALDGSYTEALVSTALGAAGATLGGPILGAAGQWLGSAVGKGLSDIGADKAFEAIGDAAGDAGEAIIGAGEDVVNAAGDAGEAIIEGAGDAIEAGASVVGEVIDFFDPF